LKTHGAGGAEGSTRKESVARRKGSIGSSKSSEPSTNVAVCLAKVVFSSVSFRNISTSRLFLAAESTPLFFGRFKTKNPIKSRAAITAAAPAATKFTAEAGAGIDVGGIVGSVVGIDDGDVVGIVVGGVVSVGRLVGERLKVGGLVGERVGDSVGHTFRILPFEP